MLDYLLRPLRYALIGFAGGLLGESLARMFFPGAAMSLWPAVVIAAIGVALGLLRDRERRRLRREAARAPDSQPDL